MLKQSNDFDITVILDEREVVEPEEGLHPETIARLKEKIVAKRGYQQTTCKEQ